jgi:CRISPR/Cas system CSM-associated protein Csm2 small subunit
MKYLRFLLILLTIISISTTKLNVVYAETRDFSITEEVKEQDNDSMGYFTWILIFIFGIAYKVFFVLITLDIIVTIFLRKSKMGAKSLLYYFRMTSGNSLTDEDYIPKKELNKIDSSIDMNSLMQEIYNKLAPLITHVDEMRNEEEIISDLVYRTGGIIAIKELNNKQELVVELTTTMKNYFIDKNTKEIIRGNKKRYTDITYNLQVLRDKNNHDIKITKIDIVHQDWR